MSGIVVDHLAGCGRVCIDTQTFIYYVEDKAPYSSLVQPLFEAILSGRFEGLSSVITLAEVLVVPLRSGRSDLVSRYQEILLNSTGFNMYPIDALVAEAAASISAAHNIRTPDALQLATATQYGADAFVTNDKDLRRYGAIDVIVLDDFLS